MFQSATLTFEHDFSIDIGNREVQIKFLGRGNTPGDAVVYLPKEKIVVAGDLVMYPIPYIYDGSPVEWIQMLENLAHLDADTIVPGHGPVMHDKVYIYLLRDLMKSAVDQMNERLRQTSPAMNQTLDDVKGGVDLTPFRQRFAGEDKDLEIPSTMPRVNWRSSCFWRPACAEHFIAARFGTSHGIFCGPP